MIRTIHIHIHDSENAGSLVANAAASVPGRAASLQGSVSRLAGALPKFKSRKVEKHRSDFKAEKHAEPERKQLAKPKHEMKLLPDLREKPKAGGKAETAKRKPAAAKRKPKPKRK